MRAGRGHSRLVNACSRRSLDLTHQCCSCTSDMSVPLSSLPESILVPAKLFEEQCTDLRKGLGRQNIEQAVGVDVAGREELHGRVTQSGQHHNNNDENSQQPDYMLAVP